jgi:hypothetical protein
MYATAGNLGIRFYSVVSGNLVGVIPVGAPTYVSLGDIDGDSVPDLGTVSCPIGIQWPCPNGYQVISGATLTTIAFYVQPPGTSIFFGWSYDRVGDIDGDGITEFLIGDVGGYGYPCCPGSAYLYSSSNGSILRTHNGIGIWDSFGWDVAGLDDIDGDGVGEYAVWSPGYPGLGQGGNSLGGRGRTFIYSGATGVLLRFIDCPATGCPNPSLSRSEVQNLGDLDGDGAGDVFRTLITATGFSGQIAAYSGRTGELLMGIPVATTGLAIGAPGAVVGDVNGDGASDIVALGYDFQTQLRHAIVLSLAPAGTSVFGTGCPTSAPRIGRSGSTDPGGAFTVNLSGVAPGLPAWLIVGTSDTSSGGFSLPLDLNSSGHPGCLLYVSPDFLCPTTTIPLGIQSGRASFTFTVPPQLTQGTLFSQWVATLPPGTTSPLGLTAALRVDF